MLNLLDFLERLRTRANENPHGRTRVKARDLLRAFGKARRGSAVVAEVQRALFKAGLDSDLTVDQPRDLDQSVTVRLVVPSEGAAPAHIRDHAPAQLVSTQRAETSAPEATALSAKSAADLNPLELAVHATVEIRTPHGVGSGVVVDPAGLILTARHVVAANGTCLRSVSVCAYPASDAEVVLSAFVFCAHNVLDFALLWVRGPGEFHSLSLPDAVVPRHGDVVYAIGSPEGTPNTMSRGIVANPCQKIRGVEWLQTDAAIAHGNSGGPLVDEHGQLLAINLWGSDSANALRFSLPVDYVRPAIEQARQRGLSRCRADAFCSICGAWDTAEPQWYCRVCGVRNLGSIAGS